jgi:hypothetical protein
MVIAASSEICYFVTLAVAWTLADLGTTEVRAGQIGLLPNESARTRRVGAARLSISYRWDDIRTSDAHTMNAA